MNYENAIVVVNKTRLEQLVARFNTKAQARFYIEHAGSDFNDYEKEDAVFKRSLESIQEIALKHLKVKMVDRQYIANYIFSDKDVVIVVGQDGLVANTAKYAPDIPIIGVNPDISRYDGILLPFEANTLERAIISTIENRAEYSLVTMAEAVMNDGQKLMAFNDFFVGPASHTSARYKITYNKHSEDQSSSGIIVSTGAGSTGWLSSVMNMTAGIYRTFINKNINVQDTIIDREAEKLAFVVREPFKSKYSGVDLCAGIIQNNNKLVIESYMPFNGKIFSDGIESDFLNFNSGHIVKIGIAKEKAKLVV